MWMTQAALEALTVELSNLENARGRSQRDQARAIELRRQIAEADTSEKPDDGRVEPGMRITVQFGDEVEESFLLTDRDTPGERTVSPKSPIGAAINGSQVGDVVIYSAPSGASLTVSILGATPHAA
jgi:transcription elongation factor GreA